MVKDTKTLNLKEGWFQNWSLEDYYFEFIIIYSRKYLHNDVKLLSKKGMIRLWLKKLKVIRIGSLRIFFKYSNVPYFEKILQTTNKVL